MVLLLRLAWKILLLSGLGFWVGCGFSRQFSVEYFSLWMFMLGSSVFNAVLPMFFVSLSARSPPKCFRKILFMSGFGFCRVHSPCLWLRRRRLCLLFFFASREKDQVVTGTRTLPTFARLFVVSLSLFVFPRLPLSFSLLFAHPFRLCVPLFLRFVFRRGAVFDPVRFLDSPGTRALELRSGL